MSQTDQPKSRTIVLDERELRDQLTEVRAQIARYKIREDQLVRALELFDAPTAVDTPGSINPSSPSGVVRSQRDVIIDLLKESLAPLTVSQITASVTDALGQIVSRTSISPVLAKLKQAGLVDHDAGRWCWRQR